MYISNGVLGRLTHDYPVHIGTRPLMKGEETIISKESFMLSGVWRYKNEELLLIALFL